MVKSHLIREDLVISGRLVDVLWKDRLYYMHPRLF